MAECPFNIFCTPPDSPTHGEQRPLSAIIKERSPISELNGHLRLWTLASGLDTDIEENKENICIPESVTQSSDLVKWDAEDSLHDLSYYKTAGFSNPLISQENPTSRDEFEQGDELHVRSSNIFEPEYLFDQSMADLLPSTEAPIENVFEMYHDIKTCNRATTGAGICFRAVPVSSQKHKKVVYIYVLPSDVAHCLVYNYKRALANGCSYVCRGCEAIRLRNRKNPHSPKITAPTVQVVNGLFMSDPQGMAHVCEPKETAHCLLSRKIISLNGRLRQTDDRRAPMLLREEILQEAYKDPDFTALSPSQQRRGAARLLHGKRGVSSFPRTIQRNRMRFKQKKDALVPGSLNLEQFPYLGNQEKCTILDNDRLVVIVGKELLQAAFNTQQLEAFVCDGRFKQKPAPFTTRSSQVYSVHCKLRSGHHFPVLQAYCADATKRTYLSIFRKTALQGGFLASVASTPALFDYERGAMAAWTEALGGEVHGCYFHWTKAVVAQRKELGLEPVFKDSPLFRRWFRRLLKIPFCPKEILHTCGDLLAAEDTGVSGEDEAKLASFLVYLETTWFGSEARFPEVWNAVKTPSTMTSNVAEGFHTRVRTFFGNDRRPPLSEYLSFISSEFSHGMITVGALMDGSLPETYIRPKDREKREKTMAAVTAFNDGLRLGPPTQAEVIMFLDYLCSVS